MREEIDRIKTKVKGFENEISSAKTEYAVLESQLKSHLEKLKEEFGIEDPKLIDQKLSEMGGQVKVLKEEIDRGVAEIEVILSEEKVPISEN